MLDYDMICAINKETGKLYEGQRQKIQECVYTIPQRTGNALVENDNDSFERVVATLKAIGVKDPLFPMRVNDSRSLLFDFTDLDKNIFCVGPAGIDFRNKEIKDNIWFMLRFFTYIPSDLVSEKKFELNLMNCALIYAIKNYDADIYLQGPRQLGMTKSILAYCINEGLDDRNFPQYYNGRDNVTERWITEEFEDMQAIMTDGRIPLYLKRNRDNKENIAFFDNGKYFNNLQGFLDDKKQRVRRAVVVNERKEAITKYKTTSLVDLFNGDAKPVKGCIILDFTADMAGMTESQKCNLMQMAFENNKEKFRKACE